MQTPAQGVVMAPVSPAVAKLLHKLQGQIIKEAAERVADTGADVIRLPATVSYNRAAFRDGPNGYRVLEMFDDAGNRTHLQTPTCFDGDHSGAPGIWYGSEKRVAADGTVWMRTLDAEYVTDDFGQLVPVPQ